MISMIDLRSVAFPHFLVPIHVPPKNDQWIS